MQHTTHRILNIQHRQWYRQAGIDSRKCHRQKTQRFSTMKTAVNRDSLSKWCSSTMTKSHRQKPRNAGQSLKVRFRRLGRLPRIRYRLGRQWKIQMVNEGKSCMGNNKEQSGSECLENWRLNSGRVDEWTKPGSAGCDTAYINYIICICFTKGSQ